MFKNIARTLANIALSVASTQPELNHIKQSISASETQAYGRALGKGNKPSGAAQLKRAATKRNNIRKFN
jgi:hypothetical protein